MLHKTRLQQWIEMRGRGGDEKVVEKKAEILEEGSHPNWQRPKHELLGGQFRLNLGKCFFSLREKIFPIRRSGKFKRLFS